jgi:membrane peptidoglycan carboxypeptidase
VRIALGLLILTLTALAINALTGPDVNTAVALVTAIDHEHRTRPVMVEPDDRIATALVAAEDDSFYSDGGVDVPALFRGLWGYIRGTDAGGSTIEVQLARMLYPTATAGLWGQLHLVTTAVEFDARYTKVAILSMYLDAAYFGHGFFGIVSASSGYFGVSPTQLTWTQAAMLAGLVQAPSALDPMEHLNAARQRMAYVLQRLVTTGKMTAAQARDASQAPLNMRKAT